MSVAKFYKLKQETLTGDYIEIKKFPSTLNRGAILSSQFQYIDKKMEIVEIDESSGVEYPDIIEQNGYTLFSNKFKSIIDIKAVSMIYYKPIRIIDKLMDRDELYWLAVVDRITCLNESLSQYDEDLSFKVLQKIVFDEQKIGNYTLFRIKEEGDVSIFVTSALKEKIEEEDLEDIEFIPI